MAPLIVLIVATLLARPELMVTVTGICEVLGAIGLLVRRTRRVAAALLIVFLITVLPANIHVARGGLTIGRAADTPMQLATRALEAGRAALHELVMIRSHS